MISASKGLYSPTLFPWERWKVQRFSWWVTSMLHRSHTDNEFDRRRQLAELEYLTTSPAAALTFAENYVGLPLG